MFLNYKEEEKHNPTKYSVLLDKIKILLDAAPKEGEDASNVKTIKKETNIEQPSRTTKLGHYEKLSFSRH